MPGTAVSTVGVLALQSSQRYIINPVYKSHADVNYLAHVQPAGWLQGWEAGHLHYHGDRQQGCPLCCQSQNGGTMVVRCSLSIHNTLVILLCFNVF